MTRSVSTRARAVATVVATATVLALAGLAAAPAASALPTAPPPTDFATWHRIDVKSPGSWPTLITTAADGAVWYNDDNYGQLVRIDPVTGVHEAFSPGAGVSGLLTITGAPDGAIWYSELFTASVTRFDPSSGATTVFSLTGASIDVPRTIAFDAAGNAWFGGANGVPGLTVIRPDGTSTVYADPSGKTVGPLTVAPDGRIWFAEDGAPEMHLFDPFTETFTSFGLGPIASSEIGDVEVSRAGEIWAVTDRGISSYSPAGALLSTSVLPSHPFFTRPASLVAGEYAQMYFADGAGGYGRVEADDSLTLFRVPFADGGTRALTVAGDGAVWFTLESAHLAWV